jgi:hypothetical protein
VYDFGRTGQGGWLLAYLGDRGSGPARANASKNAPV